MIKFVKMHQIQKWKPTLLSRFFFRQAMGGEEIIKDWGGIVQAIPSITI